MCKFFPIFFFFAFISCSTLKESRAIYNSNDIDKVLALSKTVRAEYSKTECGLNTFRVANTYLKDSLTWLNISSISIKYHGDTINSEEYFHGNSKPLPDSCIIFSKDDYKSNEAKVTTTLLFYFFGKLRPLNFRFSTYEPLSEKTKKVSDSVWIYKSVQQLVVIH